MRVIVVGNGLAGTIFSKTLRELDPEAEIIVFGEEMYLYYPRPNLIGFLAGTLPYERVFAFPAKWYEEQNIDVRLGKPVKRLYLDSQEIECDGKREKYDFLLLAAGSKAFVPPFQGAEKQGVFSLRTLDDAFTLLEWSKEHRKATVIGGGLLGLEIARALKARGMDVEGVEFFERLLPRQLDPQGASVLQEQIEAMGIKVFLGMATEEIFGRDRVAGIRFKGGKELETKMVVVAAGVRANLNLASEAGIETDKGVVVNDLLQSSHSSIYAAGDIVQHKGSFYGIIPASFAQAQIAAHNVLGEEKKYEGTVPSNSLKVMGIDVMSVGIVNPEEGTYEEFRKEAKGEGIYRKLVVQDGRAVGAIWMGTKKNASEIMRIVSQNSAVEKWKDSILEEDFDFSVL